MADLDPVARYAMALGFDVRPRTVLVEGTTDVDLLKLAAEIEKQVTGVELFDRAFTVVAAGHGDAGGTRGVIRELIGLRALARTSLSSSGRPIYRFVALFDGDSAGKAAINEAQQLDASIVEFKDVFRLWPVMPQPGSLDPTNMRVVFESANKGYRGLDWELEDHLPESFIQAFVDEHPQCAPRTKRLAERIHYDFSRDCKARLHRFVKLNALRDDLSNAVSLLKALRFYMNIR